MKRFIKKNLTAEAKTLKQLSQIDVSSKKVQLEPSDVNIGVAANSFPVKASVPAPDQKTFRTDCHNFLAATVSKISERSPFKDKFVPTIFCFFPGAICYCTGLIYEKKMENNSQILYDRK